jgi:molybdenum cofactor cytidylyltransferase
MSLPIFRAHGSRGEVAAVVLAAGCGGRFSARQSKLVADYRGRPLLRHAVEAALASHAHPTIVVTGFDRARVEATLDGLPVTCVHNADYASGLASSLCVGMAQVTAGAGALVLLGDMPGVTPEILNQLIAEFRGAPAGCPAVAPTRQGKRGNPVLLARALFAEIMQLRGDEGARRLLHAVDGVIDLPIDSDAVTTDVDTFADLEALRAKTGSPN